MKVFVVVSLLATLVSAYPGNTGGGGGSSFGGSFGGSSASFGGGGGGQSSYAAPPSSGGGGGGYPAAAAAPAPVYGAPAQAPVIHKHVYVHVPPPEPTFYAPKKAIAAPTPQKHYKIVFIKAPTPPPPTVPEIPAFPQDEQKTLIYVLVKKPEEQPDLVIPTPSPTKPSKPEVYFIRYKTQKQEGYAPSQPSSGYGAPASGPVASAPGDSYGAPAGPPSGQYGAPSSGGSGGPY